MRNVLWRLKGGFYMKKITKKLISIFISTAMVVGISTTAFASETDNNALRTAYDNIISYTNENGIEFDMTFDEFLSEYDGQSVQEYEESFYEVLLPESPATRSGGGSTYYYNTGTTCPSKATYTKYNLLSVVKKGDIIYEAAGGFGITGHIAIVEGIYRRSANLQYVRLIEAISNDYGGVVRSILDDTRADEKKVTILRVKGATSTQINNAVSFCAGELGSSYALDLAKDTSSSEKDWYCSELVWAAYKNQKIDLETSAGEPGITPHDIFNSTKVSVVSYK